MGGAEEVSSAYRSFAHRVDVGAPVERVWRAFTDSRMLERWTTAGATVTPREKGRMQVMFGEGMELDAHIDVLVTAQRMRLILLPTRGMPGTDAVIVEDFLFERAPPAATVVRLAEQRSSLEAGLGDVLFVQAPLLGAGAGPSQGVSREGSRSGTAETEVLSHGGFHSARPRRRARPLGRNRNARAASTSTRRRR